MKVIYWPQSFGKTTALVEEALKVGGVVVAKSEASKKYIEGKWPGADVCSIDEFMEGLLKDTDKPVFIDDADELMRHYVALYTGGALSGISVTMNRPY